MKTTDLAYLPSSSCKCKGQREAPDAHSVVFVTSSDVFNLVNFRHRLRQGRLYRVEEGLVPFVDHDLVRSVGFALHPDRAARLDGLGRVQNIARFHCRDGHASDDGKDVFLQLARRPDLSVFRTACAALFEPLVAAHQEGV